MKVIGEWVGIYNSCSCPFYPLPKPSQPFDITHPAATLLTHALLYTTSLCTACLNSNHLPPFLLNNQTNTLPIQPSLYTTLLPPCPTTLILPPPPNAQSSTLVARHPEILPTTKASPAVTPLPTRASQWRNPENTDTESQTMVCLT